MQVEDAAQALLERAFELGVTYFDTAGSCTRRGFERLSAKRLGEFSKPRRKALFLATKIDPRDRSGALHSVALGLKFLQTDSLDLIQIHGLSGLDDLARMGGADGVVSAIRELKVMGPGLLVGNGPGRAAPSELLRFNLRQPVACVVVGVEDKARLEENVNAARTFAPMSESEKLELRQKVTPFRSAWRHFLHTHDDSMPA